MISTLAWLDFSRDEQRRFRELLNLFTDSESRDELGIGTIRDGFSEALFPGTSTLHTRARYLLLVPWCFQEAEARGGGVETIKQRAEQNERRLIAAFLKAGHVEGLVGRRAGAKDVKTLPSTIYWSALARYRIRTDGSSQESPALSDRLPRGDGSHELVDRAAGPWDRSIPQRPADLVEFAMRGFDLSYDEADWLRTRMLDSCDDTLLSHLLRKRHLTPQTEGPWDEPAARSAGEEVRSLLLHAELFSLAMHGAALLYNLLLAEAYEAKGYTKQSGKVDEYGQRLDDWNDKLHRHPKLKQLGGKKLWAEIAGTGTSVSLQTHRFVDEWLKAVGAESSAKVSSSRHLRQLIQQRERSQKMKQARLANDSLLRNWSGAAGTSRLTYRWAQVSRRLRDVHQGLEQDRASS